MSSETTYSESVNHNLREEGVRQKDACRTWNLVFKKSSEVEDHGLRNSNVVEYSSFNELVMHPLGINANCLVQSMQWA